MYRYVSVENNYFNLSLNSFCVEILKCNKIEIQKLGYATAFHSEYEFIFCWSLQKNVWMNQLIKHNFYLNVVSKYSALQTNG